MVNREDRSLPYERIEVGHGGGARTDFMSERKDSPIFDVILLKSLVIGLEVTASVSETKSFGGHQFSSLSLAASAAAGAAVAVRNPM